MTVSFDSLNHALSSAGTFFLFATVCAAATVFLGICIPETNGKSLEELEKVLCDGGGGGGVRAGAGVAAAAPLRPMGVTAGTRS